jgi:branched-chain amino acid aminotransferase|tara:strand:+ start:2348 stop:3178 length:831 start_codon:yes stop_codon:yes gene_type:complete
MESVIFNNNIVSTSELKLVQSNRAFLYGDGVFETIKVISGHLFNYSNHFKRLTTSLDFLDINYLINKEDLHNLIVKLLKKNKISNGGSVRISFFRESLGKYLPEQNNSSYIIQTKEQDENTFNLNDVGLTLGLYKAQFKAACSLSNIKSMNAILYILCSKFAQNNLLDDAIIYNNLNLPIETSNSNIFLVNDDNILTPSLDQGCLDGTMRALVLQILDKDFVVIKKAISEQDLYYAKEVFITNAIYGVRFVNKIQSQNYKSSFVSHYITEELNKLV